VSYLAVINNPSDNVRLQRIINVPKRAIGDTMFANVLEIGAGLGMSAFEVCERADEFQKTSRSAYKLMNFKNCVVAVFHSVINIFYYLVNYVLRLLGFTHNCFINNFIA